MKLPIYLDYASTTPVDKRVVKEMIKYLDVNSSFGNPSSRSHSFGWEAEKSIDKSRNIIAKLINAHYREIIFTSGATESNNLAIKGIANFYKSKGNHIITSSIEHKSVLDTCRQLETEGFKVTYIKPDMYGYICLEKIKKEISNKTILVSIMHVNNEIGVIQDIKEIAELCKKKNIIFHVDATQSIGKIIIDLNIIPIDLLSFSGHKIYGPKGIGVLYIRKNPKIHIKAQMHGGGQEYGLRSGTLPVHQIMGMGKACEILSKEMLLENIRIRSLLDKLWSGVRNIEELYLNSDTTTGIPNILNISVNFVEGESLIMSLKDIAVSSGSACASPSLEPSYVLKEIGREEELAHSSIRFSIGRFTTEEEIDYTINLFNKSVDKLRSMSPLWEDFKIRSEKFDWFVS
ncbi:IscS subfamily cysteine desulfurase [Candidatus Annandia pinicola]|uniref:IscS subfamily cysteine desulfurase n=1 Tax=Candidatus Annandia pinicola TaxID=1345117 RepID=UPI001D00EE89|nr:IscS subfamily cysteine desulfurase [Candidatus Annandia pinicola]UDG80325.1 Cysteine desulfurase IscS [Candidatus Annandia pinicola]